MRARHFRNGPAWRVNLYEAPAKEPPAPEPDMSRGQMIALLQVRKGGDDSLFGKVLSCLLAVGSDEPSSQDWYALADARYIKYDMGLQDYVLLPPGLAKAHEIARRVARDYKLHHFTRSGGKGSGLKSRCSCSWVSPYCRDSRAGESKINSLQSAHIRDVESGAWGKREQKLTAFLNEVAPPRLPLEIPRG